MTLVENLLIPIPGSNPCGENLRYAPIYDKIKEARREEEESEQGEWTYEIKKADHPAVVKLASEALATKTKDLQLAAWMTEALLKTEGFAGLKQGLELMKALLETFWDNLYPQIEDDDLELRMAPVSWVASALSVPVRLVPINKAGHSWLDYTESRRIGYAGQADDEEKKAARAKALEPGKVAPEDFDKAFAETPKAYYVQSEATLDGSSEALGMLESFCLAKAESASPSFSNLKKALVEVRHTVHLLLEKKRELEPDPVGVTPGAAAEGAQGIVAQQDVRTSDGVASRAAGILIPFGDKEPAERRQAIAAVASAAATLRKLDPYSPAPYLMLRGLRWGELRAAFQNSNMALLEGPPTDLRQHIKRLAIEGKWTDLIEAGENAMSLPCSRGWMDLQRYIIDACVELGAKYRPIIVAIRSELKALLHDIPQILDSNLLDDTPAANTETQAWLRELMAESTPAAVDGTPSEAALVNENNPTPGWQRNLLDSYDLAREAMSAGHPEKAIGIMQREVEKQQSGRGRFLRKMQLAEVCISAGKSEIAHPIIDDLAFNIENNHLDEWEDREVVARALVMIIKNSPKVQADEEERLRLFQKVVRLDPVQAVSLES